MTRRQININEPSFEFKLMSVDGGPQEKDASLGAFAGVKLTEAKPSTSLGEPAKWP